MFYVLRHGETEWNRLGLLQGRQDSPLTALGRARAAAMGRCIAALAGDTADLELWSSPLGRARETAAIVARVLGRDAAAIRHDDRLAELDHGIWEGRTFTAIKREEPEAWAERYRDRFRNPLPGGESYVDALARARAWAGERDPAARHVVVGHGSFNRMLVAALTGLAPETLLDMAGLQDAVIVIEGRDWRFEDAGN
ncbi:MAG: histidine phosphatase family protein [Proteobacteria bacterium]|nr:histidine phosphatase family protein [Pseudomonadota bacterium]